MFDALGPCRSVIWIYGKNHLDRPFLVLSIDSLLACGCQVTVIDANGVPAQAGYSRIGAFDPMPAYERWVRLKDFSRIYLKGIQNWAQRPITTYFHRSRTGTWRDVLLIRWRLVEVIPLYVAIRFITLLRILLRAWGTARLRWFSPLQRNINAAGHLLFRPCDVIVATRPPECIVAFVVARLRRKRFVYYPFELYGCQHSRSSTVMAYFERQMLKRGVDALITQNSHRATVYRQRGARIEPVIIRNFKPLRTAKGGLLRTALGLRREQRIVLYEGGLTQGRWLDNLARASMVFDSNVVFVMLGSRNSWWRQHADEFVAVPQSMGRLIIADAVPHDVLIDYVADADVGVIIYDDAVLNNFYCEPGKLSDYVHAMVPVIAPDFPTIAPLIKELGVGVCFHGGTPQAIAKAVQEVLKKDRRTWQIALARAAGLIDWSSQSPSLIAAVTGGRAPTSAATR